MDKVLTFFEEWTLFITVMVALLALFANVVLRYGFNYSLAWSEELVREVIIYTTLIGCSAAVKKRSMIKIDAIGPAGPQTQSAPDLFQQPGHALFRMMMYYGWLMAAFRSRRTRKPSSCRSRLSTYSRFCR